jgi:hypothetical protein
MYLFICFLLFFNTELLIKKNVKNKKIHLDKKEGTNFIF